jgi:uncharacterized protein YegP (UPF0339 family)
MRNWFEIRKSTDEQYYWVLISKNGETVATSEMYTRKADAIRSAGSMRHMMYLTKIVDITVD